MFSFFKKKPKADEVVKTAESAESIEPAATEAAATAIETPAAPIETPAVAEAAPTPVAAAPVSTPVVAPPAPAAQPEPRSWLQRLRAGLSRTRDQIGSLGDLFSRRKIDEELLEELESTLLMADCGIEATTALLKELRLRWKRDKLETGEELRNALADVLTNLLQPLAVPLNHGTHNPFIIMLVGINGAGKTTSIGKLCHHFQAEGKKVLLAAGDTFRAAAREQLQEWGRRNDVTVISQDGGDPAAVAFDAINAARARGIDIVMIDTAGRLPTQLHLMEEIAKVRRVIAKADPTGPHEVLLVLDANIGQNALAQLKAFNASVGVTGLVVTKLDGTAKGGIIAAIARNQPTPLRFIGVGEGIHDLQPFVARDFVEALLGMGSD